MATIFKLNPEPTFRSVVSIPVPGSDPMALDLEFRHKTLDDSKTWFGSFSGRSELDCLMDVVAGWHNCETAFSREAFETLLQNYAQASVTILMAYRRELIGARLGN